MSSVARKIVEAVQHSMLASLAMAALIPLAYIALLSNAVRDRPNAGLLAGVVSVALFMAVAAWTLGRMARTRSKGTPLHRVHQTSNGFEVWSIPPEEGLRPSSGMRWLVMRLSRAPAPKPVWTSLIITALLVAAVLGLIFASSAFWARLHPWLGVPDNRNLLVLPVGLCLLIQSLRDWATRNRPLLAA